MGFCACLKWVLIDIGNAKKIKSEQAKFWNKPINLGNEQECSCKNVFFAEDGGKKTWVISYLEQMLNFDFFFLFICDEETENVQMEGEEWKKNN